MPPGGTGLFAGKSPVATDIWNSVSGFGRSHGVDPFHALEVESLPRPHVEDPLAAVPVAGEHPRVAFRDIEHAAGVEPDLDLECVPVQLMLGENHARRDGEEQDEDETRLHDYAG